MVECPVLHKIKMVLMGLMGLTLDITLSRSGYVMKKHGNTLYNEKEVILILFHFFILSFVLIFQIYLVYLTVISWLHKRNRIKYLKSDV